jgi:TolB-like protein
VYLSIVVLPFKNLSGDPGHDYFVDGVTDNLTTDLSHIRDSFVIASTTASTYKGRAADAKEIGKELGVRYVLEGSVQRDQNRVRVNAQLIDAASGAHLWAERFEEDVADLFKLQDEMVARLANSLGNELVKAEARGDSQIANLDAFDLTMRGRALNFEFLRRPTRENNNATRALFERALAINPEDAGALAGAARTYMIDAVYGWTSPAVDYDAKIIGQADRSIAIAPDDPLPYYAKSLYLSVVLNRTAEAQRVTDAGLDLNPSSALLYYASGAVKFQAGMFAEAKSDILRAIRLSPRDPSLGLWLNTLAGADIGPGHFDDAINGTNRAIDAGNRTFYEYTNLAVAYAMTKQSLRSRKPSNLILSSQSNSCRHAVQKLQRSSKVCAGPISPNNEQRLPPCRDPRRRCHRLLAPNGRGRRRCSDAASPCVRQSAFTSSNSTILVAPVIGTMTPGDFTIILSPSRRKK